MLYAEEANRALRDGSRGCLFGTRTEITDAAQDWATGVDPQSERPAYLDAFDSGSPVVWVCGVAGAGKSAIMTSLAIALHEMGLLGSMYSFQAANQKTLNPTNFFSTLTRHLAQRNPLLKKRLLKIILKMDPIMRATSSPTDQFEKNSSSLFWRTPVTRLLFSPPSFLLTHLMNVGTSEAEGSSSISLRIVPMKSPLESESSSRPDMNPTCKMPSQLCRIILVFPRWSKFQKRAPTVTYTHTSTTS